MNAQTQQCDELDRLIIDKLGFTQEMGAAVRAKIPSGDYLINRVYAVNGVMKVGEDYDTTPTVHIPLKATLAILLQRMGFQRYKALKIISECVTEAILNNEQANNTMPIIEAMLEEVEKNLIAKLPKAKRKGAVNLDVTVTRQEIQAAQLKKKFDFLYEKQGAATSRKRAVKARV